MPRRVALCLALLAQGACGGASPAPRESRAQDRSFIQLVETVPSGTNLGHDDIPDTHLVWREMIDDARHHIELSHFYASLAPNPGNGGRLRAIIDAIARARQRGVRVRMLLDALFADKYPAVISELRDLVELRLYDVKASMGGVQHAKYFLVDGRELYLGSANFDWRALEHIHEIGVRIRHRQATAALSDVFEMDWALAGGQPRPRSTSTARFPAPLDAPPGHLTPLFSPRGWLPDEQLWDLPALIAAIGAAKDRVVLQLLSFKTAYRDGRPFPDLEQALVRAAARDVRIDILLSHWVTGPGSEEKLGAITSTPGVTLKIVTIPDDPAGFIPFARVAHAKYMVVDGRTAWVGTSNFSGDYFHQSRNVGVFIEGGAFAQRLVAVFQRSWSGPYVETYDPARHATVKPRIAR